LRVALGVQGEVVGVRVISSGDTEAHVGALQGYAPFWNGFLGWRPAVEPLPKVEALGGSTLTSLAMAEAVALRLSGKQLSLRFPDPVSLEEVRPWFPEATFLRGDPASPGRMRVEGEGEGGRLLGFVLRTSPVSDAVSGYAGPSESLLGVALDGQSLLGVRLRKSYDTEEYVERVVEDRGYLKELTRWKVSEWPGVDFEKEKVEGVAGATLTSFAVAEGIKRRLSAELSVVEKGGASAGRRGWSWRECWVVGVLLGAMGLSFTNLRGKPWLRFVWQGLLMAGMGVWAGQFLSLGLLVGWARHGVDWRQAASGILLVAVALLVPWGTRRQVYCHHVCPHGAAQEWLGKLSRFSVPVPPAWHRVLSWIPGGTLSAMALLGVAFPTLDFAQWEPFDAWLLAGVLGGSTFLAGIGLLASLAVPQAYCRYGCPTGALLKFVRSTSTQERFGGRDAAAFGVVLLAAAIFWVKSPGSPARRSPGGESSEVQSAPVAELRGNGFGTTWSVKLRGQTMGLDALREAVAGEVERLERTLSPWRKESATSQFNAAETTLPVQVPEELCRIVNFAQRVSRASAGNYDITVGPLVSLWGYGPEGPREGLPSAEEIQRVLPSVGWEKLHVGAGTLRKSDPRMQVVLSLLQGHAVDQVARLLSERGCTEYLVELGGELFARGRWTVAVENPAKPGTSVRVLELADSALATSGLYRARRVANGREVSHFLSPKTGQPVESDRELCSVAGPSCLEAKGWAAALMATGTDGFLELIRAEGLDALWVERGGGILWTEGGLFSRGHAPEAGRGPLR
jgi:thiamine biosynthesis lipoprotein ApbE